MKLKKKNNKINIKKTSQSNILPNLSLKLNNMKVVLVWHSQFSWSKGDQANWFKKFEDEILKKNDFNKKKPLKRLLV
jgi:hypothetical protein